MSVIGGSGRKSCVPLCRVGRLQIWNVMSRGTLMYGKVFASLYQGTLRGKAHPILVFTNLISTANRHGEVDRHWRAIADDIGLTTEEVRDAIDFLMAPDPESRSPDCDGARLTLIAPHRAWGWVIVNYAKYRDIRDEEERRDYMRDYMSRRRSAGG